MIKNKEKLAQKKTSTLWQTISLAWELGYTIAIPIVVLGFGGAYADKYAHTSPLFLLVGIILAVAITSIGIYRKVSKIINYKN